MNKLLNRGKYYWICVIITAIASYGFTLTNFSMGVDDEAFGQYFSGNALLAQGRWGSNLLKLVFNSYEFLPFWRDFIAVLLMILGVTIWGKLFEKTSDGAFDDRAATIFSCVTISFSYFAHLFVFMMATIETGIVLILIPLSLYCVLNWIFFKKSILYALLGILILAFATSFSELSPIYFLSGGFMSAFLFFINSKEKKEYGIINSIIIFIKFCVSIGISLFIWKSVCIIIQKLCNISSNSYVSDKIAYDKNNIVHDFLKFCYRFIPKIIELSKSNKVYLYFSIFFCLATIFLVIFAFRKRKLSIFISGIFAIVSCFSLWFITGQIEQPLRTLTNLSILCGFSVSYIYILSKNINLKKIKLEYFVIFFTILIVFYQTKSLNKIFYADYKRYQYDLTTMNNIAYDLNKINSKKPILFIGLLPTYEYIYGDVIDNSIFNWDRFVNSQYELNGIRIHNFFNLHNYKIVHPNKYDEQLIKSQIKQLPPYPQEGYIKEFDDYTLIRLGKSFLD